MTEGTNKAYYESVHREARQIISVTTPRIALDIAAAVLIWVFGRLVFVPIAQGIFFGYPLAAILNFVIAVALVLVLFKIYVDVRRMIDGVANYAAIGIGRPYDVSPSEISHYRTALAGIFNIIVVTLAYLLFADFLVGITPVLAGVVLVIIVVWAVFEIYRVVQAISGEVTRYATGWSDRALAAAEKGVAQTKEAAGGAIEKAKRSVAETRAGAAEETAGAAESQARHAEDEAERARRTAEEGRMEREQSGTGQE